MTQTPNGGTTGWSPNRPPRDLGRTVALFMVAEAPAHGYALVARFADLDIAERKNPGKVYRALHALEKDGLIAQAWQEAPFGPARRVYSLTPAGEAWIDANAAQVRKMVTTEGVPVEARRYLARALRGQGRPTGQPYRFAVRGVVTVRASTHEAAEAVLRRRLADAGAWDENEYEMGPFLRPQ